MKALADGIMLATDRFLDNAEDNIPALQDLLSYIDSEFSKRGFDISGKSDDAYQQQGSTGAWESLGEDTGRELNGRFTALQMTSERMSEQLGGIAGTQTLIQLDTSSIRVTTATINENVRAIVMAQETTNGHLANIEAYTKVLPLMSENIELIKRNTGNL